MMWSRDYRRAEAMKRSALQLRLGLKGGSGTGLTPAFARNRRNLCENIGSRSRIMWVLPSKKPSQTSSRVRATWIVAPHRCLDVHELCGAVLGQSKVPRLLPETSLLQLGRE